MTSTLLPYLTTTSRMVLNATTGVAAMSIFFHNIANFANIQGDSMSPTLSGGTNCLVVQKWQSQNILSPGDVVIVKSPVDPEILLVKRLIAVSGQTIPIPQDYSKFPPEAIQFIPPSKSLTIPIGHVWLEGDNLNQSIDSRHFGAIPQALIVGIARAKIDFSQFSLSFLDKPALWNAQTRRIVQPNHDLYSAKQSKVFQDEGESYKDSQEQMQQQQSSTLQTSLKQRWEQASTLNRDFNANSTIRLNQNNDQLAISPYSKNTNRNNNNINSNEPTTHLASNNLSPNDAETKRKLDHINEKRLDNPYHSNSQQEVKFQKYLSSYDRVYSNPQTESIYDQVHDELQYQNLNMGSGVKMARNSQLSGKLPAASNATTRTTSTTSTQQNNQPVFTFHYPTPEQQESSSSPSTQPYMVNTSSYKHITTSENYPGLTSASSSQISTTSTIQSSMGQGDNTNTKPINGGDMDPYVEYRMTKDEQLDLLLPHLTPTQRNVLIASSEAESYNVGPGNKDNTLNNNANNNDPYHLGNDKPVFAFNWGVTATPTNPLSTTTNSNHNNNNSDQSSTNPNNNNNTTPSINNNTTPVTDLSLTDPFPLGPQVGEIRTMINPYLDVIPQQSERIVVPTAYLNSISQLNDANDLHHTQNNASNGKIY